MSEKRNKNEPATGLAFPRFCPELRILGGRRLLMSETEFHMWGLGNSWRPVQGSGDVVMTDLIGTGAVGRNNHQEDALAPLEGVTMLTLGLDGEITKRDDGATHLVSGRVASYQTDLMAMDDEVRPIPRDDHTVTDNPESPVKPARIRRIIVLQNWVPESVPVILVRIVIIGITGWSPAPETRRIDQDLFRGGVRWQRYMGTH
ncbi:hypothetical protein EDC04DRAFT_2606380 [Pisolithus marmoratus]|nr:hypothetical protein EDC04DRAFT_2606380 [Pisolithus marmoratus]